MLYRLLAYFTNSVDLQKSMRVTVESLYLEVRGTFVKTSSYRKFGVLETGYE